jgi:hypothetical protein
LTWLKRPCRAVARAARCRGTSAGDGTDAIATNGATVVFKTNVGGVDRLLRITAGLVLLALTLTGTIGAWGWIGLVPLATGLLKTCPVYSLLGISSCPLKT